MKKVEEIDSTNLTNLIEESKKFTNAIIVDLGGTLAHRSDRPKESFLTRFHEDSVDETIRDLVNLIHSTGTMVIILTGQWESSRRITTEWLEEHNVKFHTLLMKNGDVDKRDTLQFKEWIYKNVISDLIKVTFVLEDREEVVEMWRNMHVKCLQPASGQDREYYKQKAINERTQVA